YCGACVGYEISPPLAALAMGVGPGSKSQVLQISPPLAALARVMGGGRRRRGRAAVGAVAIAALVGCGRKTDVRPPELVAPRAVAEVALASRSEGVAIRWSRPTQYVDGTSMEDLSGFVIQRSRNNEPFEELTRVPVTDRGRFQKVKRF